MRPGAQRLAVDAEVGVRLEEARELRAAPPRRCTCTPSRRARRPGARAAPARRGARLQRGERARVVGRAPPLGLGVAAQHAEPAAGRVEEHAIVARRPAAPADRSGRSGSASSRSRRGGAPGRRRARACAPRRRRQSMRAASPASAARCVDLPPTPAQASRMRSPARGSTSRATSCAATSCAVHQPARRRRASCAGSPSAVGAEAPRARLATASASRSGRSAATARIASSRVARSVLARSHNGAGALSAARKRSRLLGAEARHRVVDEPIGRRARARRQRLGRRRRLAARAPARATARWRSWRASAPRAFLMASTASSTAACAGTRRNRIW